MVTIIDVAGATEKLNMLRERRPDMLEAERRASGAFATLAPFRDGKKHLRREILRQRRLGAAPERRGAGADRRGRTTKLHIIIDDEGADARAAGPGCWSSCRRTPGTAFTLPTASASVHRRHRDRPST